MKVHIVIHSDMWIDTPIRVFRKYEDAKAFLEKSTLDLSIKSLTLK